MDGIEISQDADGYTVKMSAQAFAAFAYWLMTQAKPSEDNGGGEKRKGGRPRKETQPPLTEGSA